MSVLTQISVVTKQQPSPAPHRVALLPGTDGRPAVTLVSWQASASGSRR